MAIVKVIIAKTNVVGDGLLKEWINPVPRRLCHKMSADGLSHCKLSLLRASTSRNCGVMGLSSQTKHGTEVVV